ncbi:preprotein translocase subunit YajC [Psychrobacillus sp. L4]|uniref:preprotein translocase subunit YajC n=1 Tax=Psychrobacillus sp. L4 TaxID=3236892 RepID=UPI0036F430BB
MGSLTGLLPIVAMFAVMWFFIIRPAQKRQKNTSRMQNDLKRGDQIITVGGLHAKVDAVDDKTIFVIVADGTRLQFERVAVGRVITE